MKLRENTLPSRVMTQKPVSTEDEGCVKRKRRIQTEIYEGIIL